MALTPEQRGFFCIHALRIQRQYVSELAAAFPTEDGDILDEFQAAYRELEGMVKRQLGCSMDEFMKMEMFK